MFVQTAIRFAIGRRRPGRGDRERGRARATSAGRDARAAGAPPARDPNAGVTTEPPIATRATKNPRARGKKTRARPFRSADIGVLETRGRSRQCTHRLVAHLQGLELLGGLDHLDHLERESVGVCVARGVGMEAGARETLFFSTQRVTFDSDGSGSGVFGESRLGRNRPNLPAPLVAPTCCSSKPSAADHSERARSRPGTRVRDVAVRRAGDRHGHEGAGRGEDPGSAPGGGVVQRHDGEERAVRGERSRGCGQVREAAHLLEHGQAARRRGGGAGGDQGGAAEVGQPNGAAHDRGAFAPSFRAPYSSRASGLEFSSREVLAASRDARKS